MSSSNSQTDVTEVKKYGNWSYGPTSLGKVVPYLPPKDTKAILTTSDVTGADSYGTLVSKVSAKWIAGQMETPSVVWYWMKEAPSAIKGRTIRSSNHVADLDV